MSIPSEWLELVRSLDRPAKEELIAHLTRSLDDDPEKDPDYDQAWEVEIGERLDRFESGESVPIPIEEAFAQIRAALGKGRPK